MRWYVRAGKIQGKIPHVRDSSRFAKARAQEQSLLVHFIHVL
jgi:hypothetical protein